MHDVALPDVVNQLGLELSAILRFGGLIHQTMAMKKPIEGGKTAGHGNDRLALETFQEHRYLSDEWYRQTRGCPRN